MIRAWLRFYQIMNTGNRYICAGDPPQRGATPTRTRGRKKSAPPDPQGRGVGARHCQ